MIGTNITPSNISKPGFAIWGLICLLIAVVGFWPSYFAPMVGGTYTSPATFMPLHVISSYLWLVLLVSQPSLIQMGRLNLHRVFGVFAALVAAGVLVTGIIVQFEVMGPYAEQGDMLNAVFNPYFRVRGLIIFVILVIAAIGLRNHSDWHKRLMILGTLSLLEAAYNRIFLNILDLPDIAGPAAVISHIVLMFLFLTWDRLSYGRFHPATLWGTVLITGLLIGTTPIAFSAWWSELAGQLSAIGNN